MRLQSFEKAVYIYIYIYIYIYAYYISVHIYLYILYTVVNSLFKEVKTCMLLMGYLRKVFNVRNVVIDSYSICLATHSGRDRLEIQIRKLNKVSSHLIDRTV